jgi:hypothetical protein
LLEEISLLKRKKSLIGRKSIPTSIYVRKEALLLEEKTVIPLLKENESLINGRGKKGTLTYLKIN